MVDAAKTKPTPQFQYPKQGAQKEAHNMATVKHACRPNYITCGCRTVSRRHISIAQMALRLNVAKQQGTKNGWQKKNLCSIMVKTPQEVNQRDWPPARSLIEA
eukprot:CAMPEP_0113566306 /NCGR_PEP_ID=MMETSP0015_2-20120614/22651_1 /TAXON_ID=2838 /ORGANISM="Odontella" /LENGTH=102 /DNA_ID=CAMNT_0000468583 /DNA_START=212 /DNA_END=516 /DNA_ORIENTATION=+ /assembly_acc=CAM_ASM_000160